MARGTTLAGLLTMLKAEIGSCLTAGVATADDAAFRVLLSNTQKQLALELPSTYLRCVADVYLAAGSRYGAIPTSLATEVPYDVWGNGSGYWGRLTAGIPVDAYNSSNSDDDETASPISRFQVVSQSAFEVWPMPGAAETVRFVGRKKLGDLATDSDTAELDDLLIVYWCAAQLLAEYKASSAQAKLQLAQARLNRLRGAEPSEFEVFVSGGKRTPRGVPSVLVAAGAAAGGTANVMCGTKSLTVAEDSGAVAFLVEGPSVPRAVIVSVSKPAGGDNIKAAVIESSVTAAGFHYELDGLPGTEGYVLHYEAIL